MSPTTVPAALVSALRAELHRCAHPGRARRLQARVKGETPVLGVSTPDLIRLIHTVTAHPAFRLTRRRDWETAILSLWETCTVREDRYAAVGILWHPPYRRWAAEPASMGLYRRIILHGGWWDYVDAVATRGVGCALAANPETEAPVVRTWALQEDRWLRRAAIICQRRRRAGTDRDLLLHCIVPNLDDRSKVIRASICQALESYARTGAEARTWVEGALTDLGPRVPAPVARSVTGRLARLDAARAAPPASPEPRVDPAVVPSDPLAG